MGAWDTGNFDNDFALDCINRITDGLEPVEEAINEILAVEGYIDDDYCSPAIAAAEVVAMLLGKPSVSIPESLSKWHLTHKLAVSDSLKSKAVLAVKKASQSPESELRELWQESQEFDSWYSNIQDLLDRLN